MVLLTEAGQIARLDAAHLTLTTWPTRNALGRPVPSACAPAPNLSPNDCAALNGLIISGLQCVLFQRAKAFDKQTKKA